MEQRQEMRLSMREIVARIYDEFGDGGRISSLETTARETRNILTGNGHPEEGLVFKVSQLVDAAERADRAAAAAATDAAAARRERQAAVLAAEAAATEATKARISLARPHPGWGPRLAYDVSKGIAIAIGTSFVLFMVAIVGLGLRIYFAGPTP